MMSTQRLKAGVLVPWVASGKGATKARQSGKGKRTELGVLLRNWRQVRRRSQIELSLDSGVSQRHISFLESGRSVPSRQTLMNVAQALDVPLRERNSLLLAAGYAPLFPEAPWDAEEMQSINKALKRMLQQHEPYPAVVMDRYWNVLHANEAAPRFFDSFIGERARSGRRNLLDLLFDPERKRPLIANWLEVGKALIHRVHRESVGRIVDHGTAELLERLLAYAGTPEAWRHGDRQSAEPLAPVIPYSFKSRLGILNYFSLVTTVGSPQAVAVQELRLECIFPTDEATEERHALLMAQRETNRGPLRNHP